MKNTVIVLLEQYQKAKGNGKFEAQNAIKNNLLLETNLQARKEQNPKIKI